MNKIRFDDSGATYRITLDDPPLHILDIALLGELRDVLSRVKNDRALLIIESSGGKAFSAGASVQDHIGDRVETMLSLFHDCFRLLAATEVVTLALVKGAALGGGCELALACDFVLASDDARFSLPEIMLGVFPPVAAFQMSHLLAPRKGLEMMLTGDAIGAAEAAASGLVNAVFSREEFDAKSAEWIARLTRHSASSLRFAKRAFRLASTSTFPAGLPEIEQLYLGGLMQSSDANEGLQAFVEKRRPEWKHR